MKKKVILIMAGVILLGCVGCSNEKSPEKGNTSNGIEIENVEVENIEVENVD